MAVPPPAMPSNFLVQQANGQVYVSWSLVAGASSYLVERSTDQLNWTSVATPTATDYLDTTVVIGTEYFYRVSSTGVGGTGLATEIKSAVPTVTGDMSLGQIRLASQQRADRVGSNFVTTDEWNSYINQSYFELYDLLVTAYEDYFVAPPVTFAANGSSFMYPLPDGKTTFMDQNGAPVVAPPIYKLMGVDLSVNTASNAYVTVNKFNFAARNRYVYPNTASTIYGVFNCQYRMVGNNIQLIPTPSGGQFFRLWYIPRLAQLLKDSDITAGSLSGWTEYIIVDAAIKALQKEESDVSVLFAQKQALIKRIEESAVNRDAGQPDSITDVRQQGQWGSQSGGYGWSGPLGGF